eukprot:XP_001698135.1 predicted protein [Chlamydomonas reinhardtii]
MSQARSRGTCGRAGAAAGSAGSAPWWRPRRMISFGDKTASSDNLVADRALQDDITRQN